MMRMMTITQLSLAVFIVAAVVRSVLGADRPNIVLIMTDNHGPWTLGCYGNEEIRTPHIDRLAKEGTMFLRAFANNAVCSPTRATWLTGLMPSQHGVHRYLSTGRAQIGPNAYCTIGEFRTLPKVLQGAGYVCGLSGKWHLGDNLRAQEGFSFWITKPHGHTKGFYDQEVIEDGKIRTEPGYLTELWTERGIEFIEENRQRPFFLMLAYNGPYGLGTAMVEPIKNRHRQYDLKNDAGERNNLYGRTQFAEVQQQLKMRLDRFFRRYADPKWDLWHGGKSKSGLITEKLFQSSM